MSKPEKTSKNTTNTILLVVLLIISLFNGCATCNNKKTINRMHVETHDKILKAVKDHQTTGIRHRENIYNHTIDLIEQNAEATIYIEKEIDNKTKLEPTQVKKMFNQHRTYDKLD